MKVVRRYATALQTINFITSDWNILKRYGKQSKKKKRSKAGKVQFINSSFWQDVVRYRYFLPISISPFHFFLLLLRLPHFTTFSFLFSYRLGAHTSLYNTIRLKIVTINSKVWISFLLSPGCAFDKNGTILKEGPNGGKFWENIISSVSRFFSFFEIHMHTIMIWMEVKFIGWIFIIQINLWQTQSNERKKKEDRIMNCSMHSICIGCLIPQLIAFIINCPIVSLGKLIEKL